MGQSIDAKLFYGVCLDPGEHCEYELDEDGYEDERKPTLMDQIQEKFPDFEYGSEHSIEGWPAALKTDITGWDENLRTYVMLKDSAFEVCPGDMEIDVWMTTPDDQPFKDFFELVGPGHPQSLRRAPRGQGRPNQSLYRSA